MRTEVGCTLVAGGLLIAWLGSMHHEALAEPIAVVLLAAYALLVLSAAASYRWRTPLPLVVTSVLSGAVLGLGIAASLLEPTLPLWSASVPFALGGLGAVWASRRRREDRAREASRPRRDRTRASVV